MNISCTFTQQEKITVSVKGTLHTSMKHDQYTSLHHECNVKYYHLASSIAMGCGLPVKN
jgi:hypothetical protein